MSGVFLLHSVLIDDVDFLDLLILLFFLEVCFNRKRSNFNYVFQKKFQLIGVFF